MRHTFFSSAILGCTLTIAAGCASDKTCAKPPQPAPAPPVVVSSAQVEIGRAAYQTGMCFKCHGPDGAGTNRAPSLTDDQWLHCDGSIDGILAVIDRGVPKAELKDAERPFAMNPASNLIPDADTRRALAEYVWTLSNAAPN